MRVAISGSHGFVGSALTRSLGDVLRIGRDWNSRGWEVPEADIVVHLAGEPIVGRWTEEKKKAIRDSRIEGTSQVAEALPKTTRLFICASAVGYYGNRGSEILTESSQSGDDFLANVAKKWEAAADPARAKGIRTVHLRFGMILGKDGGALPKMLMPFKLGLGGPIGDGSQYWPWIAIDDVAAIVRWLFDNDLAGPINVVAPDPPTNLEFTKTLGNVLHRPTAIPVPLFAARAAFGELADAVFAASVRAVPEKLQKAGYAFRFPNLEEALKKELAGG